MADLLRTDYKDDVLNAEVNTQRKYQMITNDDGTISFVDVTDYSQVGDSFGGAVVNAQNEALANNEKAITALNDALTYKSCSNTNLNTITKPGIYTCGSASEASTANNFPVAAKGHLVVLSPGGVIQQIYYVSKSYTYTRTYWDGAWSAWQRLVLASELKAYTVYQNVDIASQTYAAGQTVYKEISVPAKSGYTVAGVELVIGSNAAHGAWLTMSAKFNSNFKYLYVTIYNSYAADLTTSLAVRIKYHKTIL